MPGVQSYDVLLKDPLVSRWIRSYQKAKTRDDYARGLQILLVKTGLRPQQLLDLDAKEARQQVMDIVRDYLDEEKYAGARQLQTVAKSFFEFHDKSLTFKRSEKIKKIRKKVAIEVIPRKDQVYAMANHVKKQSSPDRARTRALILSLFQSGVRVGCLCNWTIGLVRSQLYPAIKVPVYLKISNQLDTKLSGYGLDHYYTFLQQEAAEALRDYIDLREQKEGSLKDGDLVFVPARKRSKNKHTEPDRILWTVKAAARAIGIDPKTTWTHALRKSFRKVLNASDVDEDTKEALMGHSLPGSRGNYFDYHDVDEAAQKYMRCDFAPGGESERRLREQEAEIKQMQERLASLEKITTEKLKIKER